MIEPALRIQALERFLAIALAPRRPSSEGKSAGRGGAGAGACGGAKTDSWEAGEGTVCSISWRNPSIT